MLGVETGMFCDKIMKFVFCLIYVIFCCYTICISMQDYSTNSKAINIGKTVMLGNDSRKSTLNGVSNAGAPYLMIRLIKIYSLFKRKDSSCSTTFWKTSRRETASAAVKHGGGPMMVLSSFTRAIELAKCLRLWF